VRELKPHQIECSIIEGGSDFSYRELVRFDDVVFRIWIRVYSFGVHELGPGEATIEVWSHRGMKWNTIYGLHPEEMKSEPPEKHLEDLSPEDRFEIFREDRDELLRLGAAVVFPGSRIGTGKGN